MLWAAAENGGREDSQGLRKSAETVVQLTSQPNCWPRKRARGLFPTYRQGHRKGGPCLVRPSPLSFLKGIVALSIDGQMDENICRIVLYFLKQLRVKNRTKHHISHLFLWSMSTVYWLIFSEIKVLWRPSSHATSSLERRAWGTGGVGQRRKGSAFAGHRFVSGNPCAPMGPYPARSKRKRMGRLVHLSSKGGVLPDSFSDWQMFDL